MKFTTLTLVCSLLICVRAGGDLLPVAAAKKIKIGFVLGTLQEERYQKDQKYFTEEAKRLGFEPIVVAADNNEHTQASKVENLLADGVKALVIQAVNSDAAASLVKEAHDDKV